MYDRPDCFSLNDFDDGDGRAVGCLSWSDLFPLTSVYWLDRGARHLTRMARARVTTMEGVELGETDDNHLLFERVKGKVMLSSFLLLASWALVEIGLILV